MARADERRAKAAALRKQQIAQERRSRLLKVLGGLVALVLVAGLITYAATRKSSSTSAAGQVMPAAVPALPKTTEPALETTKDTSGIDGVVAYKEPGAPSKFTTASNPGGLLQNHPTGHVVYSVTPPVGGDHNRIWMTCGVYTKPVPTERAVHNLEHGAVWITYRPSLAADQVALLRKDVLAVPEAKDLNGDSSRFMDLTPWADESLPSPIVVSSWGHQLKLDNASDPRLEKFIGFFRLNKSLTPELGSPCVGEPLDVGGRPAAS